MKLFDLIFGRAIDRRIAAYQNDLITKHCDEVQNIYKTMRGWRHDYHNHIQAMLALIDKPQEMKEYLLMLNDDLTTVDTVIKTGNVMVDAILNSKLSLIKSREISVNAKAIVPPMLEVSQIDLCAIIGNLLDNAMEACLRIEEKEKRFIRVFIGILKGQLYISITNSMGNSINKNGSAYVSSKTDTESGLGLMRIDRLADKYQGFVNRKHEDDIFATEIMLPLNNSR